MDHLIFLLFETNSDTHIQNKQDICEPMFTGNTPAPMWSWHPTGTYDDMPIQREC